MLFLQIEIKLLQEKFNSKREKNLIDSLQMAFLSIWNQFILI